MGLVTLHPPVLAAAQLPLGIPGKMRSTVAYPEYSSSSFLGSALADWDSWDSLERAALAYVKVFDLRCAKHGRIRGSTGCIVQIDLVIGGYHLLHLPTNYFTLSYLLATSTTGNLRLDLAAAATIERPRRRWYRPPVDRGVTRSKPSFFLSFVLKDVVIQ